MESLYGTDSILKLNKNDPTLGTINIRINSLQKQQIAYLPI